MGRKRKEATSSNYIRCNYCSREFEEKTLKDQHQHQQDAYFKCEACSNQQFQTNGEIPIHVFQEIDTEKQTIDVSQLFMSEGVEENPPESKVAKCEEEGVYKLSKREKRALEVAPGFKSNYPWFAVPIVKSHKHQLILPFKFVKEYLPKESMNAEIVDSNETTWTVDYKYKKGRSLLYTGWNSFWLSNELKEGDICAFELIDKEKIKLKVTVRKNSN